MTTMMMTDNDDNDDDDNNYQLPITTGVKRKRNGKEPNIKSSPTKKRRLRPATITTIKKTNSKKLVYTSTRAGTSKTACLYTSGEDARYDKDFVHQCYFSLSDVAFEQAADQVSLKFDDVFMMIQKKDIKKISLINSSEYTCNRLSTHANIKPEEMMGLRGWKVIKCKKENQYITHYLQMRGFFLNGSNKSVNEKTKEKCRLVAGNLGAIVNLLAQSIADIKKIEDLISEQSPFLLKKDNNVQQREVYYNQLSYSMTKLLIKSRYYKHAAENTKQLYGRCNHPKDIYALSTQILKLIWYRNHSHPNLLVVQNHKKLGSTSLGTKVGRAQFHNFVEEYVIQQNVNWCDDVVKWSKLNIDKCFANQPENKHDITMAILIVKVNQQHTYGQHEQKKETA